MREKFVYFFDDAEKAYELVFQICIGFDKLLYSLNVLIVESQLTGSSHDSFYFGAERIEELERSFTVRQSLFVVVELRKTGSQLQVAFREYEIEFHVVVVIFLVAQIEVASHFFDYFNRSLNLIHVVSEFGWSLFSPSQLNYVSQVDVD